MLYYDPYYPTLVLFFLICGVLMIVAASYAIKKVWEGSKNKFAYVLLAFTFLLGISYSGLAFAYAFEIKGTYYDDFGRKYKTVYVENYYAYIPSNSLHLLCALQGWIFGVCYLISATNCSFNVGWLTENKIKAIGWTVGVLYFVYQTFVLVYVLSTFPGSLSNYTKHS